MEFQNTDSEAATEAENMNKELRRKIERGEKITMAVRDQHHQHHHHHTSYIHMHTG